MHLFANGGVISFADPILGHTPIVAVEWDGYARRAQRERHQDGWFQDRNGKGMLDCLIHPLPEKWDCIHMQDSLPVLFTRRSLEQELMIREAAICGTKLSAAYAAIRDYRYVFRNVPDLFHRLPTILSTLRLALMRNGCV